MTIPPGQFCPKKSHLGELTDEVWSVGFTYHILCYQLLNLLDLVDLLSTEQAWQSVKLFKLPESGEDVEEEEGEDDDAGPELEEADEEREADASAREEDGHGIQWGVWETI